MKPKLLLRIAAGCLLFFAVGHSLGHMNRYDTADPRERAVLQAMAENKFDMFGSLRSYDENYTGMSLNLIFTLLAFSIILIAVSGDADVNKTSVRLIILSVAVAVLGFAITSFLYFFIVPAVTCALAFLALAASLIKRS